MNTVINNRRAIPKTKHTILMLTAGGKLFFTSTIKKMELKNDYQFKNCSSPFRRDRSPSFSITCDRYTNRWNFKDFGDVSSSGDVFVYAAKRYGLDLKTEFMQIIERMWEELKIDQMDQDELLRLLEGITTNETQIFTLKVPILNSNKIYEVEENVETKRVVQSINLDIIEEVDLCQIHKDFLTKTGIKYSVMKDYNAFFIKGYTVLYDEGGFDVYDKKVKSPHAIWICYRFNKFCKIYCPKPKKFWSIGTKNIRYSFGTPYLYPEFEDVETVILAAGEKDVLTLLSKGYRAMCENSETTALTRSDHKGWYRDCKYRVIVLYDIDNVGINQAKKLKEEAGFPYILLPDWLKEKGGKDVTDFFSLGGTEEELNKLIEEVIEDGNKPINELSKLPVRTAMQRLQDAKSQPDILPHADVLFQSNELTIFFGDTGKGKSIFAVALADAISKGMSFLGLENRCLPLKVLYYDFELSDKQFEKRYTSDDGTPYFFNENLFIDNVDLSAIDLTNKKIPFSEILIEKIKNDVKATSADVLIIDNITFLSTYSPEDGQVAMHLMKLLKELKNEEAISIFVLAHTPKKFGLGGISLPDLAGSKHLSNFCDSVGALGVSKKDASLRYIIQVKPSRTGEIKYDSQNIILCEIQKIGSFLTFEHRGYAKETEHLHTSSQEAQDEMIEKARELQKEGKTLRQISEILGGVSKSTVGRWLNPGNK